LQLRGQATVETIAAFVEAIERACRDAGVDGEALYSVKLAVEEVCLNVLNHGYRGESGPLAVDFQSNPRKIVITISDSAPPFAPEDAPPVDTTSGWEERGIGGYGWHLVKSMMDRLEYETAPDGGNRLTLTKMRV